MKSFSREAGGPSTAVLAGAAEESARAHSESETPRPLGPARLDWETVRRVLVVRLRSIGDTVLATPALYALRRFLPQARLDLLLEDWVAPLLAGSDEVDQLISVRRGNALDRARLIPRLRDARYDVAFNLHGGTTATFLTRASGARHRVGYAAYRYARLYNHLAPPSSELWQREKTHSAEQQLALIGWMGVPVSDRPAARLPIRPEAAASAGAKLRAAGGEIEKPFVLLHPAAAFASKQWDAEHFARVADHLAARGLPVVAIAAPQEEAILRTFAAGVRESRPACLTNLSLPELTEVAARARLFVGNDSGVAHIAAATGAPSVVIFGSSNVAHWGPWSPRGRAEVVREEMPCAPCPGYTCGQFDAPECIRRVPVARVLGAIERVLGERGRLNLTADGDE